MDEKDSEGRTRRFWLTPSNQSKLQAGDRLVITPLPAAYNGMQVELATAGDRS
jgi:hypothetical protein